MSGHSKWSTIRRQKEATDKQRGKIFTKLARAISLAVREGGGVTDPDMNFKLRLAIEKAKQSNMPKAKIERAMASGKGKGEKADAWEEVTYEGYGPAGSAVIAEAVTDSRNRTLSEVKQIFDKSGGSLGQLGSVSYMFDRMGWLLVDKSGKTVDSLMLELMEIPGVIDMEDAEEGVEVYTEPTDLKSVRDRLSEMGLRAMEAELIMKPKVLKRLSEEDTRKVKDFLMKLQESDDVQHVYCDILVE